MAQVDSENSTAVPNKPPAGAAESPACALYFPTDISPDELFEALGRLRREAQDEIERLIDLLDRTDSFFDEREQQVDDGPIDGDVDAEDSLSSTVDVNQTRWAAGGAGDREGDGCADDRECDEEQHGGDGAIEDNEPSLGWTAEVSAGGRCLMAAPAYCYTDLELAPSAVTEAVRRQFRQSNRWADNNDGWHVDAHRWFNGLRRIRNLSDHQRQILRPHLDRGAVSIW